MKIDGIGTKVVLPAISIVAKKILGPSLLCKTASMAINTLPAMTTSADVLLSNLPSVLLRGGETVAAQAFSLDRAKIRLEGLHAYGVIAAMFLNSALRMFSSTPKRFEEGKRWENVASVIFVISTCLSVFCGAYTTVVYSMLGMYYKTALGLAQDDLYLEFFASSTIYRKRAFDAFLFALFSFELSFTSSLFLNYSGKARWVIAGASLGLCIISWWHWHGILELAKYIFHAS
jgi:hypothetical protein